MTKTSCVKILLLLPLVAWANEDLTRAEREFAEMVNKDCDTRLSVSLHDYSYGRDESSLYSRNHFEDASLLTYQMAEACKMNPANKPLLKRISTIYFKRGSIQERKLIQRKNGDLVYLANRLRSEQSLNKTNVIANDLKRVLKLSFEKAPDPKIQQQKIAEDLAEKKAAEESDKKVDEQQKKIEALTAWFQAEVKKITATPGPDMSKKLENLSKIYEEKLNALTTP